MMCGGQRQKEDLGVEEGDALINVPSAGSLECSISYARFSGVEPEGAACSYSRDRDSA